MEPHYNLPFLSYLPKSTANYYVRFTGKAKKYYETGKLEAEATYNEDGRREGPYKLYFENGRLGLSVVYKNGEQVGEQKEYYPGGQIGQINTYRDGKRVHSKTYDIQGKLTDEEDDQVDGLTYIEDLDEVLR